MSAGVFSVNGEVSVLEPGEDISMLSRDSRLKVSLVRPKNTVGSYIHILKLLQLQEEPSSMEPIEQAAGRP